MRFTAAITSVVAVAFWGSCLFFKMKTIIGGIGLAGFIAFCFQAQRAKIVEQQSLIEDVLGEVRAVRQARGLDVDFEEPVVASSTL